jgi:phosphatidate cytidylyltransferase
MQKMLKRILVAVIGIPALIGILSFAPSWATVLLTMAMCGIGAHELMQAVAGEQGKRLTPMTVLVAAGLPAVVCGDYAVWNGGSGEMPSLVFAIGVCFVFILFLSSILHYGTDRAVPFSDLTMAVFAGLVFPLMLSCLLRLRLLEYGELLVWTPLVISFGSDSCALFAGMAFGKHKMAPLVSPHKTVEGGIGGLLGGVLGLLLLKWAARAVAGVTFLTYWQVAMIGLVCAVVSEIGDLSFSVIKREFGVKDYGKLLPGHGGVLDRFDSVTFTAPMVYFLLLLLGN